MEETPKTTEIKQNATTPSSTVSTVSRPFDEDSDEASLKLETSSKAELLMLLAPTTRRSAPDRNRTLLTAEKDGEKPTTKDNSDLEEGRESLTRKVNIIRASKSISSGEQNNDDSSTDRNGFRKKLLWCAFAFSLLIGIGAGVLGYFYMRDKNETAVDKRVAEILYPGDLETESPSDSPTLSPTGTPFPTGSPSVSLEPTRTWMPSNSPSEGPSPMPSDNPSERPTLSPTGSPTTSSPSGSPSNSPTKFPSSPPTVSPEPTPFPTASPTRDKVAILENFLSGSHGVDVARRENGEHTTNTLAIDWLAQEEAVVLDLKKLVQRFALVAIDLELHGAKFDGDTPRIPKRSMNHCEWKGIKCDSNGFVEAVRWDHQEIGQNRTGMISPEVRHLVASLKVLDLSNNGLVGEIPEGLYKLTSLEKLYLFKNRLEGTISTSIGTLDYITHFHLSHNKLSGTIPTEVKSINGIRPLEYFNVYSNKLTGTLPQSMRLRSCIYFDVGRNNLTGTLPKDLGEKFVNLRHLHLDHNAFTGTLPSSYNTVGNGRLESFSLNHNQLTGVIPGERDLYNKLVQYTLHSNRFQRMDSDTCRMEIPRGEMVELRADCNSQM